MRSATNVVPFPTTIQTRNPEQVSDLAYPVFLTFRISSIYDPAVRVQIAAELMEEITGALIDVGARYGFGADLLPDISVIVCDIDQPVRIK